MDMQDIPDVDPQETQEWLDALDGVIRNEGAERAQYLLDQLVEKARRNGAYLPFTANTAYCNTIPAGQEERSPGDHEIEDRIRAYVRWNAMAMVVRANRDTNVGGHIASYASAADLFEVGFNHFFRAASPDLRDLPAGARSGDLVFFQPHAAPGVYARAFMEGRLTEEQLGNFRRETSAPVADATGLDHARGGLSSYCHPWLMPHFWQFPTGSMGIGPISSIYHARFMLYLTHRQLLDCGGRKVWGVFGDGEMDEPESLGAIGLAARERLDNLIFVVNCNLQRLDGPVRGNGKII